jgi:hypothetical protein
MKDAADGRFTAKELAFRLFVTCWLVYSIHLATNTVREIYLALSIGGNFSFRVDEYAGLHPDLFEKPGHGWHINNNPGASMLGAIPYAAARPLIDVVVERVNAGRRAAVKPPAYESPWPLAQAFYAEAWKRGLDVRLGLAAVSMQVGCMALVSALAAVVMFRLLGDVFASRRAGLWLALLYAFGTPVFFRTGYLNQNMLLGHAVLFGMAVLWAPRGASSYLLAGLAGGAGLLMDYSGVVALAGLAAYAAFKAQGGRLRALSLYAAGAAPGVLLLWWYQWRSFGNPFLPAQHWMPGVAWIEQGYQGVGGLQWDLLVGTLFDSRYGLFPSAPLFLLAAAAPWLERRGERLPWLELWFLAGLAAGFVAFSSAVHYSRLQYGTGVRYMAAAFAPLFVLTAVVLMRMPRAAAIPIGVVATAQAWAMAMCRDVERGRGVAEPVLEALRHGVQLPALTVLSRMKDPVAARIADAVSPAVVLLLTAAALAAVWSPWIRRRQTREQAD